MKVKKIVSGLLACMLLTSCSDQDLQKEFEPGEKNIQVELDVDLLTETYGPALTRSIAHLDGISTFALPAGITAINIIPDGEIPAAGETKTIVVSGSFTSILIRATDAVNATTIREIAVVNAGGMGYGTMVIPPYESTIQGSVRVVIFEYYNYTSNSWEMFNYAVQNAVIVTPFSAWSDITGDIPKEGGNYTINISGNFPSQSSEYVFFQAVDQSNNLVSSSTVAIVGNTQKSVSLTITANTQSSSRVIYLQYKRSTDSDFITFETHVQSLSPALLDNYIIPGTSLYLAKKNAAPNGVGTPDKMNWAVANGISETYLYNYWPEGSYKIYNTGCNGYYEKSDASDKGLWRLPTKSEMELFAEDVLKTQVWHGFIHNEDIHWTSTPQASNPSNTVFFRLLNWSPLFMYVNKRATYYARCVREI